MANIDLITGFLGAGKTTFIRKYAVFLRSKGERIAVIENEYGSKGIDSQILAADGIATDELYGGCICCTLKVGFHDMLVELSNKVDRIIVEPSGVYDISQFYAVMASPRLKGKCSIGNVICIVDPTKFDVLDALSLEMLSKQVKASGAVVFSMVDDPSIYTDKLNALLGYYPKTIEYNDFDKLYTIGYGDPDLASELTHSAVYLSTTLKPCVATVEEMKERIAMLYRNMDLGEVLRVKGVWNGYLVNSIDGKTEIYKCNAPDGLNVIGVGIKRKKIMEVLCGGIN